MKYRWIGQDINLDSLAEAIENFFEMKKFKMVRDNSENSYQLSGTFRTAEGEIRTVIVTVSKTPNDFTVQLTTGQQMDFILKLGFLTSFFGGGGLLLKKHRTAEFYRRLEEDFWRHIEITVSQLLYSAKLLS